MPFFMLLEWHYKGLLNINFMVIQVYDLIKREKYYEF